MAAAVLATALLALLAVTLNAQAATLDPGQFVVPGELLAGEGEPAAGSFGSRVALSADGNTALVGAPNGERGGAVWAFTRSGAGWAQQGPPLRAPMVGAFGSSVALSADGNEALIGAFDSNVMFVYTRSASGWTNEGTLPGVGVGCGASAALSASGQTALVGCPGDVGGAGSAIAFHRSGGAWAEQEKLYGIYGAGETAEGQFGRAVALSADGNTALVGGPLDSSRAGAAWVFVRTGATWSLQGGKLTGRGEAGQAELGGSVGLSASGDTALLGGSRDNEFSGAVWVFARAASRWIQQGGKLTGAGAIGHSRLGYGLALSGDGRAALIGGFADASTAGAVWAFDRSGSSWAQVGPKFTGPAASADAFGSSLALSGDAYTALVGAPGHNGGVGGAWGFLTRTLPAPAIRRISPARGPAAGGTTVTIIGTNLADVNGVSFGTTPAAGFVVNSPTSITAVAPEGTSGKVSVTVVTPWGTSPAAASAAFKYLGPTVTALSPSSGPSAGGTSVMVMGTGFALGASTTIAFGKTTSGWVNCTSTTRCTVASPAVAKGATVDVTAAVGEAKSRRTMADRFRYE